MIGLWFIGMKEFDTPEPQTSICGGQAEIALAHKASDRLIGLLNGNAWTIEYFGADSTKEKRRLATIRINGVDVGDIRIRERLARLWPDWDEWWCNLASMGYDHPVWPVLEANHHSQPQCICLRDRSSCNPCNISKEKAQPETASHHHIYGKNSKLARHT